MLRISPGRFVRDAFEVSVEFGGEMDGGVLASSGFGSSTVPI